MIKPKRLCTFYIKELETLIFHKTYNYSFLNTLFYQLPCEILAFENTYITEKLQTEFLRYIKNSEKSTPAYMLHAELGCKAVDVRIKTRMISFWMNIVNGKQTKLSKWLSLPLL